MGKHLSTQFERMKVLDLVKTLSDDEDLED